MNRSRNRSYQEPSMEVSSEKKTRTFPSHSKRDVDHSREMNSKLPPSMRVDQKVSSFPSFQKDDYTGFQHKGRKSHHFSDSTFRHKSFNKNYFPKVSSNKHYLRNEDSYNQGRSPKNIPPSFQGKMSNYSSTSRASLSTSPFVNYGKTLFSTREFDPSEPRIFFNKYLRKKYIIMNIVGSNNVTTIK